MAPLARVTNRTFGWAERECQPSLLELDALDSVLKVQQKG